MPLFPPITVDLSRLSSVLEEITPLLKRGVEALERLAPPPLPASTSSPRKAQLSDLRISDAEHTRPIQEELESFAALSGVIPGSPAFVNAMLDYEEEVLEVLGSSFVALGSNPLDELPWNKVAGYRIFDEARAERQRSRQAGKQPDKTETS